MSKKALITGITGQDGSYLAELLLAKGYEVHGIIRRASTFNTGRLEPIYADPHSSKNRLFLHYGDLSDASALAALVTKVQPDEIYNLAAQSHVRVSFDSPEYTTDITATGTVRLLEAIRQTGMKTRFYQASSSEMYGMVREMPQTEKTPFYPRSPYGVREGLFVLDHGELPRVVRVAREQRDFVQPRIAAAGRDVCDAQNHARGGAHQGRACRTNCYLGNLDAKRDWGYATEYVEAMWLMLQQDKPDDYVIATNETHSVREFLELAFARVRSWTGKSMWRSIRAITARRRWIC